MVSGYLIIKFLSKGNSIWTGIYKSISKILLNSVILGVKIALAFVRVFRVLKIFGFYYIYQKKSASNIIILSF